MSTVDKHADADAEKSAVRLLKEMIKETRGRDIYDARDVARLAATAAVSAAPEAVQIAFARVAADQIGMMRKKLGYPRRSDDADAYLNLYDHEDFPTAATYVMSWLLRRKLPWTATDLEHLVSRTADVGLVCVYGGRSFPYLNNLVTLIEKQAERECLAESMRKQLGRLAKAMDWDDNNAVERKLIVRLDVLREGSSTLPIQPGEAWSDAALAALKKMKSKERQAWEALLGQCAIHNPHKPSDGWLANAKPLLKAVGFKSFQSRLKDWAALVGKPGTRSVRIPNTNRTDNTLLSDPQRQRAPRPGLVLPAQR